MTVVGDAIPALLGHLQRLGRDEALRLVRQPIPAEQVRSALASEGLGIQEPVVGWFSAWDGQDATGTLGTMDVLPGFYALSLADALEHRRAHGSWPGNWLPVLADGGGDFFVLDTGEAQTPVVRHRYDQADAERAAATLDGFIRAVLRAYESGVVFVADGYLEQDEDAWRELLRQEG